MHFHSPLRSITPLDRQIDQLLDRNLWVNNQFIFLNVSFMCILSYLLVSDNLLEEYTVSLHLFKICISFIFVSGVSRVFSILSCPRRGNHLAVNGPARLSMWRECCGPERPHQGAGEDSECRPGQDQPQPIH